MTLMFVFDPLAILLAQIVTIILVARFFGMICKKIGQPSVIGEIMADLATKGSTSLPIEFLSAKRF